MKFENSVHYTNQSLIAVAELVGDDISYSVLWQILKKTCTDIYTNGKSFIICYSNAPYPIWVWCENPQNATDVQTISHILANDYMSKGKYNFIICEQLLDELKKTDDAFNRLTPKMELLSYELRHINKIERTCDGRIRKANAQDAETLALLVKDAVLEMEGHDLTLSESRTKADNCISGNNFYVWCNEADEIVALTNADIDGKYAKLGMVYTIPAFRRKGYAMNAVHAVSKNLIKDGLIPVLYTNGGYTASNECYKKIGFKKVGRLWNVGN